MVADFGYGVIVMAFLVALYSAGAAIYGERTKSTDWIEFNRRAMLLLWPLISISAASLIYLLITNHFEVSFVYEVTSREMPTYLKITAWWGGQAGSLVFWSWLMAAFASLVTLRKWDRDPRIPAVGYCRYIHYDCILPQPGCLLRKSLCIFLAGAGWETHHRCGWQCHQRHARAHGRCKHRHSTTRQWIESIIAPSGDDYSSADALSWVRVIRDSIRVRHRSVDHGPHG